MSIDMKGNVFCGRNFEWINPPEYSLIDNKTLSFKTKKETDLWMRTHYGFKKSNAHLYLTGSKPHASISATFKFNSNSQYDQFGLVVYVNESYWIKTSVEFEDDTESKLGVVVTNSGFSDWSTQNISSYINQIELCISRSLNDYIVKFRIDSDHSWQQLRICNLQTNEPVRIGIYGCSPIGDGATCMVTNLVINESETDCT